MEELKEKVKKSHILQTRFFYLLGYLLCTVTGACDLIILEGFIKNIRRYQYYGINGIEMEHVILLCIGILSYMLGVWIIGKRARLKAFKQLEYNKDFIHMIPLEMAILVYVVIEAAIYLLFSAKREYVFTGISASIVFTHFCENVIRRKQKGNLWENSFSGNVKAAARAAGIVIPFMVYAGAASIILFFALFMIFANSTYSDIYYMGTRGLIRFCICLAVVVAVPCVVFYLCWCFDRLLKASDKLASGEDGYRVKTDHMAGLIKVHGENLNSIAEGVNKAVEERLKSERLKTELITNVSHDIKTPLTSIINYADLITKEETENERIREYADVLGKQSQKLKRLIENLIEASKASTGNIKIDLKPCSLNVLLAQMTGEYEQRLNEHGLTMVLSDIKQEVYVMADGSQLWRVFDNLMGNICKYAMENTRVYIDVVVDDKVSVIIKNISASPLNLTEEELMERFTRGDGSRSTSGNGLGLSIAQSLMKLQRGSLNLVIDGDLFKAIVKLEKTTENIKQQEEKIS